MTFVDLPGFGYAQVSKQDRQQWQRLIEDYLITARNLRGVVIIVDIRRGPEAEEAALCDFLTHHQRSFVLVATKCDKLKRSQLAQQRQTIATRLGSIPPLLFSAESGMGKEDLWQELSQLAFAEVLPVSSEIANA